MTEKSKRRVLGIGFLVLFLISFAVRADTLFPIANTSHSEMVGGGAFDGTNFLISFLEDTGTETTVNVKIVAPDGSLVGDKILIGDVTEFRLSVGFDGTNYLIVWQNDDSLYGRFVSQTGTLVGENFLISSGIEDIGHIGFGGGNYLIVYNKETGVGRKVYGRTISTSGTVGSEFAICSGEGKDRGGLGNLPFDGKKFLVVWTEDGADQEVRGRFVGTDGTLVGEEFTINGSETWSDNPWAGAFDGTNFLVVWPDEIGGWTSNEWTFFGQLIDTSGNKVGGVISVTGNAPPSPSLLPALVFDGTNYLFTWCQGVTHTEMKLYGRFISKDGKLIDTDFLINTGIENQLGGVVNYLSGEYFFIVNEVTISGIEPYDIVGIDIYGATKTIVPAVKGDMDTDGEVDITDVIKVLRKAVGLDP
jgi:hypothetical protein